MILSFKNEAGLVKQVKFGVSWTAFFWGVIPFFVRGMWGLGILWTIAAMCTLGLSNFVMMFLANKQKAHFYLENGYRPVGNGWKEAASAWDIVLPESVG